MNKVGDRVRIKKYKNVKEEYYFSKEMKFYCGKTMTIVAEESEAGVYHMKEDNGIWSWVKGMFEVKI